MNTMISSTRISKGVLKDINFKFIRAMSAASTDSVIFESVNKTGIITLNRPKALNALDLPMVNEIYPVMRKWEAQKGLVIIKGAGEKAFCAGGDVRAVVDSAKDGGKLGQDFFREEYKLNRLIGSYSIPYVALIDGITMGGGLGLSVHGQYRIATERSMIAMPETQIGLFPDVGGSFFLPRLSGNLGLFLGLTGQRLKGRDVFKSGIATHFVPSNKLEELQDSLTKCETPDAVYNLLKSFHDPNGEFSLKEHLNQITSCFAAATVEEIIERLEKDGSEWAVKIIKTMAKMSPGSMKITLRALQRGSQLDLTQCLQMEYRLACRALINKDFIEGVRALLIDKDNSPNWDPKTLADVTDDYIESYFKKLPADEELRF